MTGHEAAQQVMSDSRFAKNYRNWASYQRGEIPEGHPLLGMVQLDNMLHSDGDDHGRLRGLISKAFTPRRVRELRPQVEKLVGELLDGMEDGSGRADVKADLATPLPMGVICELFGIPERDKLTVRELVSNVFSTVSSPEEAADTQRRVNELFSGLIADKRENPGEDLTSALIGSHDENDRLSEVELLDTLWLMMAAGFETTMGALTNTVRALLTHRDQLDLVRRGECSWDAVIEEGLRWDTSVASLPFRFPTEDVEIGGRTLREGEPILVSFASANRDPEQHGDAAEVFDITRKQKRHLSFGHGVHFCLGAPLARMEMQVALPALFDRFPDLALAADSSTLTPFASIFTNCPTELPVSYTPR